jgi:hypothetical protein
MGDVVSWLRKGITALLVSFIVICIHSIFPEFAFCFPGSGPIYIEFHRRVHFLHPFPPSRIVTGGLRFWKDGRDVPNVMLALYYYEKQA